jgi:hypothetical protein
LGDVGSFGAAAAISAAQAADDALPQPHHLSVADDSAQTRSVELASLRYAQFWNTGEEAYARQALSGDFVDRTRRPDVRWAFRVPCRHRRISVLQYPI